MNVLKSDPFSVAALQIASSVRNNKHLAYMSQFVRAPPDRLNFFRGGFGAYVGVFLLT